MKYLLRPHLLLSNLVKHARNEPSIKYVMCSKTALFKLHVPFFSDSHVYICQS